MKCLLCNDWIESLPKLRASLCLTKEKSTLADLVNISLKTSQKKDVKIVIKSYMEMLVLIVNFG